MLIIFYCAKVELLQVYFRYTLNIFHLKTDIIHKILIKTDIKTHFRLNIKKCALCTSIYNKNKVESIIFISVSFELSVSKYINRF